MTGRASSPRFDLDRLEDWISRNHPASTVMNVLLLQLERMIRVAFQSEIEILYEATVPRDTIEIAISVRVNAAHSGNASLALCCQSGRFFKRYGLSHDERSFFKGPHDATQYLLFVLKEYRNGRKLGRR